MVLGGQVARKMFKCLSCVLGTCLQWIMVKLQERVAKKVGRDTRVQYDDHCPRVPHGEKDSTNVTAPN